MTNVYFFDLGTGYLLAGFSDFESAFEATDSIYRAGLKIAYLNESTHICETEVLPYTRKYEKADRVLYQNYLTSAEQSFKESATESFRTALAALESQNNFKANFIAVICPQYSKQPILQKK